MARNIKTEVSPSGENLGARNWRLEFSLHHALPTHVFPSQDPPICRIPCLELKGVQSFLDWFLLSFQVSCHGSLFRELFSEHPFMFFRAVMTGIFPNLFFLICVDWTSPSQCRLHEKEELIYSVIAAALVHCKPSENIYWVNEHVFSLSGKGKGLDPLRSHLHITCWDSA